MKNYYVVYITKIFRPTLDNRKLDSAGSSICAALVDPEFLDLFDYDGSNEIELIRIMKGWLVPRDWFVFESVNEALMFFSERCDRLIAGFLPEV